jgi:methyltransferase
MILDSIGAPQIVALLVLTQRGLEELYSGRNTRRLIAEGAHEEGCALYPMVAATHLAWIAAIGLMISPSATVHWPAGVAYMLLQGVRYWVIGSLGRYWTHRIITLPEAPLVNRGPYAVVRHPNYLVTVTEAALLPLAFGAVAISMIFTALWIVVIRAKIVIEDQALACRR